VASRAASQNVINRWLIATAGVVMQGALGAVYAWSVFRIPLSNAYGSSVSAVNATFSIAILGIIYLIMVVGAGFFMKNPPEGWKPEGWEPEEERTPANARA
jgi:hypothetical protein